ncbi:conserved hypothetical protein [Streptomyces viridosporus ATCC 14672]|uniref:Peptidoglycan recognition protein family domain-containing protein n=1 Tax=Streptomyces viridosporus (strain ATCC 14672 / DSM 40746 / JCM 4963 / KCTC 9882 / NRRL B-12104 / FH 1290) TaxID=566461 RepID=D6A851_STRV1|nr:conserved hypothetical protein [Streptomyces viridosporus ATCC 14672]
MVPPGGTPHIADGAVRAHSGTMRVPRRPRGARVRRPSRLPGGGSRTPGLPRAVAVPLGCLPGLAAAVALVLCAHGVEHAAESTAGTVARTTPPAHTAPRPPVVPRSAWLGDAAREQPPPRYDDEVVAVFVHHTDSPNGYDCADAPGIIRHLYEGQTRGRDWDDLGYNFVVDRCGTVYEGRAGGVDRPVTGAHTQGFNHRTTGIAALGTFTEGVSVSPEMLHAIAALAAWKLGTSGTDPRAGVRLVSQQRRQPVRGGHRRRAARRGGPQRRLHDQLPGRRPARPPPGDPGARGPPPGAGRAAGGRRGRRPVARRPAVPHHGRPEGVR